MHLPQSRSCILIPMLMDTGGNCGSQSSTLIIRGIALGEIRFSDLFRVMFKEFRCFPDRRCSTCTRQWTSYSDHVSKCRTCAGNWTFSCSYCHHLETDRLSASIVCKKLHMDPAIMALPLITTLVDTCSILIYFNIATRIFQL